MFVVLHAASLPPEIDGLFLRRQQQGSRQGALTELGTHTLVKPDHTLLFQHIADHVHHTILTPRRDQQHLRKIMVVVVVMKVMAVVVVVVLLRWWWW
jgi:hypothetical protein